jgi:hypothetical protein
MVVISVLPRTQFTGSLKRVNEKSVLYSVSRFAMQFSITIGTNRTREIKLNSDQFRDYFMSL